MHLVMDKHPGALTAYRSWCSPVSLAINCISFGLQTFLGKLSRMAPNADLFKTWTLLLHFCGLKCLCAQVASARGSSRITDGDGEGASGIAREIPGEILKGTYPPLSWKRYRDLFCLYFSFSRPANIIGNLSSP